MTDRELEGSPDGGPITEEALLAHEHFVRGLARRFVSESEAEDLTQEVLLAALQRPPRSGPDVKGWLARVTRNLAVERKRARGRRSNAERSAARDARLPSTLDRTSHGAVIRALAAEVLSLHEPYRTALLLQFYEGLGPSEIARRLDEPVETVRTRVKRGVELLRRRLDARSGGDRGAWLGALVAWLGPRRRVQGSGDMGRRWRPSRRVALSSAPLIVLGAWLAWRVEGVRHPEAAGSPHARAELAAVASEKTSSRVALLPAEFQLDVPAGASDPTATDPLRATSSVAGRVLDLAGKPVPGALVRSHVLSARRAGGESTEPSSTTRTDETGAFLLTGLGRNFVVAVESAEYVGVEHLSARLDGPASIEGVELRVAPPRRIEGLVRGDTGSPMAGAAVELVEVDGVGRPGPHPRVRYAVSGRLRTTTASDGSFVLDGLARAAHTLRVHAEEHAPWQRTVPIDMEQLEIGLTDGAAVAFQVFGADGLPRPDAAIELLEGGERIRGGTTDAEGRVEFRSLAPARPVSVRVDDREHAPGVLVGLEPNSTATSSWQVELEPARGLVGRVVDTRGAIVPDAWIVFRRAAIPAAPPLDLWGRREAVESARFLEATRAGSDGGFVASRLAAGALEVEFGTSEGPSIYQLVEADARTVDLVVGRPSPFTLAGRIVDAESGRAIGAGGTVRALEEEGAMRRIWSSTGDDGAFSLHLPGPGPWSFEFRAPGFAPCFDTTLLDVGWSERTVELRRACSLRLRVEDRLGQPLAGARLVLESSAGEPVPVSPGPWAVKNSLVLGPGGDVFLHEVPRSLLRLRLFRPGNAGVFERELDLTGGPSALADGAFTWALADLDLERSSRSVTLEFAGAEGARPTEIRLVAHDAERRTLREWSWRSTHDGSWRPVSGIRRRQWLFDDRGWFVGCADRFLDQERSADGPAPSWRAPVIDLPSATRWLVFRSADHANVEFDVAPLASGPEAPTTLRVLLVPAR